MSTPIRKILVLAANPKGTDRLRLDEEVREIQEGLQRSRSREHFVLEQKWAVRPRDIQRALLDIKPQIVHFAGHGAGEAGLIFEDIQGEAQLVGTQALANLFKLFANTVECVVLNGCYSAPQAEAIAEQIPAVVGMSDAISDRAAIEFAVGFYDALGAGENLKFAYDLGCNAIAMAGVDQEHTPVLLNRSAEATPSPVPSPDPTNKGSRIFISYKRGAEPDESVTKAVYEALQVDHQVFIDQTMPVGTLWAERIEGELTQADYMICFLSEHSIQSEMVAGEVEKAHKCWKQGGKPAILPIRLNYREPFTYPLSAYLDSINWAFWDGDEDTPRLITELQQAINGRPLTLTTAAQKQDILVSPEPAPIPQPKASAQPAILEMPEGSMDPESKFYVERQGDKIALGAIERQGVTITIKGPRQMGKSSLLLKTVDQAVKKDKRVAFIDFQLFDEAALADADRFYQQFCLTMTDQLEIPNRIGDFWQDELGNNQRCTRYMQTYVLRELNSPFVLAMDEVDRIFDRNFRSDFFSMLRNWHNNRGLPLPAMKVWKKFDLVLVTATEPYHLIADLHQSPFNVGEVISLKDFTAEQVVDLNQRHGSPLTPEQDNKMFALLNGHPYLIRKALYLAASGQRSIEEVLEKADRDDGPFGDHLRYHLFRIYDRPELVKGMLGAIKKNQCEDERIVRLLSAAGLIRQEGKAELPRCQLYGDYFRAHLE
ncbi:AAA-like domain-containing protein [Acaryochloris marina NIES-2412]|uniref:AAA-like domain-containing protein n=1 Tax=Acaryochloris marina TaxID=155978 RepID=UPI004058209D